MARKNSLNPELLIDLIVRQPGIDIDELIDLLNVRPILLYKTLKKIQGDARVCDDDHFLINSFDGPLTFSRLDAILEEAMMKRGDISKAVRLSMVLDLLNTKTPYGGVTIKELCGRYGVGEKSIRRYLETLENEMGVGVIREETPGKPTRFLLDRVYLSSISPEKAIIIFLSLLQQKGSALAGHINAIKDALIVQLFKNRYHVESLGIHSLQDKIHIIEEQLADPVKVGDLFGKLISALKENCRVKIWYFTAYRGAESERVVEPYGLICKRQNWYLVGYCLKSQDVRTFRVDRIRDVHLYAAAKFEYPGDFSLREHMGKAWGVIRDETVHQVTLKFNSTVAHQPKTIIFHPSQKIAEEMPDGSLLMTLEVSGLDELKTWILQWGNNIEVLEPDILRKSVKEAALKIAGLYND